MESIGNAYANKTSEWGPRDPSHTLKKLHEALQDYYDCIGMTADRLYDAYQQIHLLTAADFPESLQPRFRALIEAMTSRADTTPRGEQGWIGNARNTLRGMSPKDSANILSLLTDLIYEFERSMGRQAERYPGSSQAQLFAN